MLYVVEIHIIKYLSDAAFDVFRILNVYLLLVRPAVLRVRFARNAIGTSWIMTCGD